MKTNLNISTKLITILLFFFVSQSFGQDLAKYPEPVGGMAELAGNVVYPETAKVNKIEGKVMLEAKIDETGKVVNVKVVKSIDSDLDEAAKTAVYKTKFIPAVDKDGKKVKASITIPINFKLK